MSLNIFVFIFFNIIGNNCAFIKEKNNMFNVVLQLLTIVDPSNKNKNYRYATLHDDYYYTFILIFVKEKSLRTSLITFFFAYTVPS